MVEKYCNKFFLDNFINNRGNDMKLYKELKKLPGTLVNHRIATTTEATQVTALAFTKKRPPLSILTNLEGSQTNNDDTVSPLYIEESVTTKATGSVGFLSIMFSPTKKNIGIHQT